MASLIEGVAVSDERTKKTMKRIYAERGLLVDPHTAVGCAATEDHLGAGAPWQSRSSFFQPLTRESSPL